MMTIIVEIVQTALWYLSEFLSSWFAQALINIHIVRDIITYWRNIFDQLMTLNTIYQPQIFPLVLPPTCFTTQGLAETLILFKMTYHNPLISNWLYIMDFTNYSSWNKVLYPFLILYHILTWLLNSSFWMLNLAGQNYISFIMAFVVTFGLK